MTEYTGQNWPYEALQEAKKNTPSTHAHVLLVGEAQDVDGIEIILKTLSYLQKYGRPFLALYNYTHKKPHRKFMFVHEDPLKHTSFLVPVQRLALLDKMIKQRSNLVYEIQHGEETITNIPEHTQETFMDALKQALEERGWSPRLAASKYGMHYTELKIYLEAQKKKIKQEHPAVDRWFTSLEKVWKTVGK
jgi:hypothetical protein